jgi:hypothetical protein
MAGKSTKDSDKKSSEENAIGWPPADYREFVQTQIANKMMLWLGGIGITSIFDIGLLLPAACANLGFPGESPC